MPAQVHKGSDPLAPHSLSASELKELLATERAGRPFLAFRDEHEHLGFFVTGHGGDARTVGRGTEMDLSIPWDREVSVLHAELHGIAGHWTIVDDGLSTNGTFINGERVSGRQRLRDGDRIRVGRTILVYSAASSGVASSSPATSTLAAGDEPALQNLSDTQRRVLVALCRPYREGGTFATPASNPEIAAEVFLSLNAVKLHLRTLFGKFGLTDLPQNEKRARLAECVLQAGVISRRDLD